MRGLRTVLAAVAALVSSGVSASTPVSSGRVTLVCEKPGNWTFAQRCEMAEPGVDIVTVTLKTADGKPALAPKFSAVWQVPLVDIAHIWAPSYEGCQSVTAGSCVSKFSEWLPVVTFFSESCENRLAVACSEASRSVKFSWTAMFRTVGKFDADVSLSFFEEPEAPLSAYEVCIRLDARRVRWDEAVRGAADWVASATGAKDAPSPAAAYEPVYSTWYAFERAFDAATLERECAVAAQLGMRTLITDDGWQRTHGDWEPITAKFPDFRAHVARIQALGLKYVLWYSLAFMNEKSANYRRFEGKYLKAGPFWEHRLGMLDPRFPEVRAYIVGELERLMRDYGLDGFKLDFLDSFCFYGEDPAIAQDYAGRDEKSVPAAAAKLMREIDARLKTIRPDVLIEFRQPYVGPLVRAYGNMFRASDCPGDAQINRVRTTNVRLVAGNRAVHADMLKWSADDTPENAARNILSVLFSAVQYSMKLDALPEEHRRMVAKWLAFSREHRVALQQGGFRAYAPQANYPLLEGWSDSERIFVAYSPDVVIPLGEEDGRRTIVVNATSVPTLCVRTHDDVRAVAVKPSDFAIFRLIDEIRQK